MHGSVIDFGSDLSDLFDLFYFGTRRPFKMSTVAAGRVCDKLFRFHSRDSDAGDSLTATGSCFRAYFNIDKSSLVDQVEVVVLRKRSS